MVTEPLELGSRVGEGRQQVSTAAAASPAVQVLAAPNVKLFNATAVEDLIVKDLPERGGVHVAGAVTNWTLVALNHDTQSCM